MSRLLSIFRAYPSIQSFVPICSKLQLHSESVRPEDERQTSDFDAGRIRFGHIPESREQPNMSARPPMSERPPRLPAKFNQNRSLESLGISPVPFQAFQTNFLNGVHKHQKKAQIQGGSCVHIFLSRQLIGVQHREFLAQVKLLMSTSQISVHLPAL
jgi:hypothetical protein